MTNIPLTIQCSAVNNIPSMIVSSGLGAQLAYTLVTVMDTSSSYKTSAMANCLQLMPVSVGSGVLYTPIANS